MENDKKKKMDPRHQKRIKIVQNLYAYTYQLLKKNLPFPHDSLTDNIIIKLKEIDECIKKYAPRFPLDKIARIDLSILRMSVHDLVYLRKTPKKVVIDEAIRLAKELSGEKSYAFINAVLGKVLENISKAKNKKQ